MKWGGIMKNYINETTVLDFYLDEMEKDNFKFLKDKDEYKRKIKDYILKLKQKNEANNKIQVGKDLWKTLFEASMSYIDPDKRGYDKLFKYFDEYVNFEELIFASDSFYRDHTMHCLWVYFLGEYIMKSDSFSSVLNNMYFDFKIVLKISTLLKELPCNNELKHTINELDKITTITDCFDSIRCVNALTHDLGYPIKKINMINKSIKTILPYFGLDSLSEFSFNYSDIQNNTVNKFIQFLSTNLNLNFNASYNSDSQMKLMNKLVNLDKSGGIIGVKKDGLKEINDKNIKLIERTFRMQYYLVNLYPAYLRYSGDFERYEHGIMSAFLLVKTLKCFESIQLAYIEHSKLTSFTNAKDVIVKAEILTSITNHNSNGYQIKGLIDSSAFLAFIDELEEFSRMSRANQNRQYINEFCKTDIYMDGEFFNIDFIFDNSSIVGLDPEISFKGKCKRFLSLFNINELDDNLKLKFRCIGKLPNNSNTYELEIRKKYANIIINGIEQKIPEYLKTRDFYTKEEYINMQ